jgi:hypothetical protein
MTIPPFMKAFLPAAVILCGATSAHGVSNRVFENLEALEKAGFAFTAAESPARGEFAFGLGIPKGFHVGGEAGTKPFSGISLMQTKHKVEHGPLHIGADGTHVPLKIRKTDDGHHETKVRFPLSDLERLYLVISFAYPGNRDWPVLIHVPLASVVKQLEARQAVTRPPAPNTLRSPK